MNTKICTKCKLERKLCDFNKDSTRKDNLSYYCKVCTRQHDRYRRGYTKKNNKNLSSYSKEYKNSKAKEYYQKNKYKQAARSKLNAAIKKGLLEKYSQCQLCSSDYIIEAHHYDYNKPLDVIWLCKICHDKLHKNNLSEKYLKIIKDLSSL